MKLEKTYDFVKKAHEGQVDKNGCPYINHLVSVYMIAATKYKLGIDYQHAALLHDVIEDTETTMDDLIKMGYSPVTLNAVNYMTVVKPATAMENIHAIISQADTNIIKLKMADNEHNRALHRIVGQPFRLIERYVLSWNMLNEELIRRETTG